MHRFVYMHKYTHIQILLTAQKGRMWHMSISTNKVEEIFLSFP